MTKKLKYLTLLMSNFGLRASEVLNIRLKDKIIKKGR